MALMPCPVCRCPMVYGLGLFHVAWKCDRCAVALRQRVPAVELLRVHWHRFVDALRRRGR